jgi:hypothetical protein
MAIQTLTQQQIEACKTYLAQRNVSTEGLVNVSFFTSRKARELLGLKSPTKDLNDSDVAIYLENLENGKLTGEAHAVFLNSLTGKRTVRLNKDGQSNIRPWLSQGFNYDFIEPTVIVESAIKAYSVYQNTGMQAAAFGGMSTLTKEGMLTDPVHYHLSKLEISGHKELFLCLDAHRNSNTNSEQDTSHAIKSFCKAANQLHPKIKVRIVKIPCASTYDKSVGPDDFISNYGAAAFLELCDQAAPFIQIKRKFDPEHARVGRIRNKAPEYFPFIVEGLFPVDVGTIAATGGQGKTTLLMHLAVLYILGRDIFGCPVNGARKRAVLFISGEDDEMVFGKRLNDICKAMDLSEAESLLVNSNFYFEDFSSDDVRLAELDGKGNLQPTDVVEKICTAYLDHEISWIIADPLMRFSPGERHVNDGIDEIVKACRKLKSAFKAFVLLVHHVSKDAAQSKQVMQHAGRGGTALADGCRLEMQLVSHTARVREMPATITNDDFFQKKSVIALHIHKLSWWKCPNDPFWISRDGYQFKFHAPTSPEDSRAMMIDQQIELDTRVIDGILGYLRKLPETDIVSKSSLADRYESIAEFIGMDIPKRRIQACISIAIDQGQILIEPLPEHLRHGGRKDRLRAIAIKDLKF